MILLLEHRHHFVELSVLLLIERFCLTLDRDRIFALDSLMRNRDETLVMIAHHPEELLIDGRRRGVGAHSSITICAHRGARRCAIMCGRDDHGIPRAIRRRTGAVSLRRTSCRYDEEE